MCGDLRAKRVEMDSDDCYATVHVRCFGHYIDTWVVSCVTFSMTGPRQH